MGPYFQFYRGTTFKRWSRRKFFIANVFTNADEAVLKYSRVPNKTGGNLILFRMFFPSTCPYSGLLVY